MIGEKKMSLAKAGKFSQKRKTSTAGCQMDPLGNKTHTAAVKTASTLAGGRKQPAIKMLQTSAKQTTGKTRRVTAINGFHPTQT